jgi:7-cyano-7-deazaguanine synthase
MPQKRKIVTLLSGGMDSTTLIAFYLQSGHDVRPISINYGQKHFKEIRSAHMIADHYNLYLERVDLSVLGQIMRSSQTDADKAIPEGHYEEESMKQTVTPNRNMVLISIAAAYAISIGADGVAFAAHHGDHAIYPDCRPAFVDAMRIALSECYYTLIRLEAPFLGLSKQGILHYGLALKVPYEKTWTCYKGGRVSCGRCGTCVERLEAFHQNNIPDPLEYEDREWWETQTKGGESDG